MALNSTARTLIDYVLTRLRKPTLASRSVTDITATGYAYELMVMGLVQDAIREVEAAWDWEELRATVTFPSTGSSVDLTASTTVPNGSRILYSKAAVGWEDMDSVAQSTQVTTYPLVYDTTNTAAPWQLQEVSTEQMNALRLGQPSQTGDPVYFSIENTGDATNVVKLRIWPTPATSRTIKARMFVREADLAGGTLTTATNGTSLPLRLVGMRALLFANEERGSNLGAPDSALALRYQYALVDEILAQMTAEDLTGYAE